MTPLTPSHPEQPMSTQLDAIQVTADLMHKRDVLRRLLGPEKWGEHMRTLIPIVRQRMEEQQTGAMSAAISLATQIADDPECPDTLPLFVLSAGVDLVSNDTCQP